MGCPTFIRFTLNIKRGVPIWIVIPVILAAILLISSDSFLSNTNPFFSRSSDISASLKEASLHQKIQQQGGQDFGDIKGPLPGITSNIASLEFSPSGRFLAIGAARVGRGVIWVWDVSKNDLQWHNDQAHIAGTNALAFSPDEKVLASGGGEGEIGLWNVSNGKRIKPFPESVKHRFWNILFSPDGTEIIGSNIDVEVDAREGEYLTFWNISTGELTKKWNLPDDGSQEMENYMALSPNGSLLATGSLTGVHKVMVWDISITTPGLVNKFSGKSYAGVGSLDFSPDGTLVVSGGGDGSLHIWNLTTETEIPASPLIGHNDELTSVKFSPQGSMLVSAQRGRVGAAQIRFWDTTTWQNFDTIQGAGAIQFLAFAPSGHILAMNDAEEGIIFRNVIRNQVQVERLPHHTSPVTSLTFGPNDSILASADSNAHIQLWNGSTQQALVNFTGSPPTILGTSVTRSADGQWLVSGSSDQIVRFWNVSSGQLQYALTGHESSVISVAFSPDGRWLASGDGKGTIKLWNVTSPTNFTVHSNLTGHVSSVFSLSFSPNSGLLASGGDASSILVWNLTTGKTIASLPGHKDRITSVTFAPDGTKLVSASWDGTVKIWAIPSGTLSEVELVHPDAVNTLDYSQDGKLIASGGSDGIVRIWNATTGLFLTSFQDQGQEILSLAFSPDATLLAAAGRKLDIFLYDLDPLPLDIDGDSMDNPWELTHDLDPLNFEDTFDDPDTDGLMNSMEYWLKTNPREPDSDSDGMDDLWEYLHHSDPAIPDEDQDVDQDEISNLYEYQMGLNSFINDSWKDFDGDGLTNLEEAIFGSWANQSDSDLDGMPDWYEYEAGTDPDFGIPYLDPLVNDAQKDLDQDGIPNLDEYLFGLKAWDPEDALLDSDGDGINNLAEYRAGTDPRDFWSVPLESGSIPHLLVTALIIIFLLSNLAYFQGKRLLQRRYIRKYSAPDYPTAKRVQQANLPNYDALLQAQEEADEMLTTAASLYHQGAEEVATEKFIQASEVSQHLGYLRAMVEADLRVVLIAKESGTLTAAHAIFQRIPPLPSDDPYTAGLINMLLAVREEISDNWGAAEKFWYDALLSEELKHDFRTTCQGALVESAFRSWFYDQSSKNHDQVHGRLEEWKQLSEASDRLGSLCPYFLFRARFALASYDFEEANMRLEECIEVAKSVGLHHYLKKAEEAKGELVHHKKRIETLVEAERFLSPDEEGKLVQQYLQRAIQIKTDFEG
jgi:WD40 repeat protein